MATKDTPDAIENEPYEGFFKAKNAPVLEAIGYGDEGVGRQALAETLRDRRIALGLSLDEVSEATRVRKTYLEAIEQVAYDVLPSRAFAIGYIKAYARALNLDEESLAELYKSGSDEGQIKLQAPIGAALDDVQPDNKKYFTAAMVFIGLIVAWNIIQRMPAYHLAFGLQKPDPMLADFKTKTPLIYNGLIPVAQAAPAPPDQDIPPVYFTPGLEDGFAAIEAANADKRAPRLTEIVQNRKAFNARGAIFGALPENSNVVIQAKSTVNLIIRAADGTVRFAQVMGPGTAYRIPMYGDQDLIVDVGDEKAFEVYYNGEYAGGLPLREMPIKQLNQKAAQQAHALDQAARQNATKVVVTAAAPTTSPIIEAPTLPEINDEPLPYIPSNAPAEESPDATDLPTTEP